LYRNNSSAAYSDRQLADYCTGTIHLLLIATANWQIIVPEQFICCYSNSQLADYCTGTIHLLL
jgi:hypothetical protein